MPEPTDTAAKDRVPCNAENRHAAHNWTFADGYPLMRCPGVILGPIPHDDENMA